MADVDAPGAGGALAGALAVALATTVVGAPDARPGAEPTEARLTRTDSTCRDRRSRAVGST